MPPQKVLILCVFKNNNSYALMCNVFFALILGLGQYFKPVHTRSGAFVLTAAQHDYDIIQLFLTGIE